MPDRDKVLDALMDGLSVEAAADRFNMREADVAEILKAETDRVYDGSAMRAEWTLTGRRLRRMELAFDKKAITEMDCAAAIVALKASERRATLTGANAPTAHLGTWTVMHAEAVAEQPNSTQQMLEVLNRLKYDPAYGGTPKADEERQDEPK